MNIEELQAYEVVDKKEIEDLHSTGYLLRHKKSGARIALLSNTDPNKVFYIGFRTPPADSTGVAHILEHSVLEGSREFPVKDPFIELVKGSLNTFLNAMTYPDKTLYPVASCNDKDFANLMHVYLDAVFYPNIYREPRIFYQEGWHYELQDACDELTINGVVYNEMKGAFSSPDDVLEREISTSLYPDTPYGFESGGDPEAIPQLTYEGFLDFHRKYYHPSNSYLYLYGDMDMAERLDWIDAHYLSHFEKTEVFSEIPLQKSFKKPVEVRREYPITREETVDHNTYFSYNISVGNLLDRQEYIAFQILDYALLSSPGAPLKQALLDAGIGQDVYGCYENGILQPYFSIVAKNAQIGQKDDFRRVVEETLKKLVEDGLDKKTLCAGLNYYEFKYREADFGSYPAGLMYGLQVMDSWLYDESAPFVHIEAGDTYRQLRRLTETDYFERLIENRLLQNPHKSLLMLAPTPGLAEKREEELKRRLQNYKASLSKEEVEQIVQSSKAQEAFAEEPDDPEALKKIPLLSRTDIKRETEPLIYEEHRVGDTLLLYHPIETNRISYFRLLFDCSKVPTELFPYLGILKALLGMVDTKQHGFRQLAQEMDLYTGGISAVTNIYTDTKDPNRQRVTFEIKGKAFHENLGAALRLTEEILLDSQFTDAKRIGELMAELKSRMQSAMMSAGHLIASSRAMSYQSRTAALTEMLSGMDFYRLAADLTADFTAGFSGLSQKLEQLVRCLFRPENLLLDFTAAQGEPCREFTQYASSLKERLFTESYEGEPWQVATQKKNEGFMSASSVQYVCRAGNYLQHGLPYTGALRILRGIMNNDYLWNQVRVRGGAYGCMCGFSKNGDAFFVSYRDPNLGKTVEVYERAADFVETFAQEERALDQAVIGAISDMDIPLTPSAKALRALGAFMTNQTEEELQRERDQVLDATVGDIRALAAYIRAFMEDDCLCTVGNEKKIREEKALFMNLKQLF